MNSQDNALFLLAQRYHKRRQTKGTVTNWFFTRKGPKNKKYICHLCNKEMCQEASKNPRTVDTEYCLSEHGKVHLKEHGLEDFI